MRDLIGGILRRYGQPVKVLHEAGAVEVRCFLQPAARQGEQTPDGMCSIGALDRRLWLYLGQEAVQPGEKILWDGQVFRVRSSRVYHMGETLLYWWASLEQEGEAVE